MYPTNIKEAIEWLHQADLSYQDLYRDFYFKVNERVADLKETDSKARLYRLDYDLEVIAKKEFIDLGIDVDIAKAEVCRRSHWLEYLNSCAQGGIHADDIIL